MSRHVQAATRGNQNRVAAQASESSVISVPGASPRRAASPAYLDDLTQIARDESCPGFQPRDESGVRCHLARGPRPVYVVA